MIEMTQSEIEYWEERASEPMHFEPYPEEIQKEFKRKHPSIFSKEEAWKIIRESQGIS